MSNQNAPNDTLTDENLLARLKNDDREAYNMLVERYLTKLWRLAVNVLYNDTEAEDVVQEVMLTIWQKRQDWEEGTAKFSTWIYRVTLNRCIDLKRRRKPTIGTDTIEETMPSESQRPADQMMVDQQDRTQIFGLLQALPANQKAAIILFYYEELNVREISIKLSTTEQGARSLLKRGRKALKDMLESDKNHHHHGIQGSP